ncbi:Alpha/Beta hydrolase fold [Lasallia pustulata]|uniref:Alpha/Beta hydrolase fold n=1 Tax=Lasallia pustulata TaxID=136370 RepID=A0A1W5D2R4_9LECA|nr:Alpha/Beta hydrolase fold [Lasallia pustulata]
MSSALFLTLEHVIQGQHIREYPAATVDSQEEALNLHIKHYVPLNNPNPTHGDVTVVAAHAIGFPKELYEPLWDELLQRSNRLGFRIRGIWIADIANQGKSSVLNEDKLGNDPSWFDHPRDLLHIINHFRDQMPRPIVGIGHSMGGNNLVNLSLIHPRLLTSLVLLDPVIIEASKPPNQDKNPVTLASTVRRDLWPSREVAAAWFGNSKFYQTWDARVLKKWIEFGLRDLPTAIYPSVSLSQDTKRAVTLTTPKHQEVFTFSRPNYAGQDATGKQIINRTTHADLDPADSYSFPFYRPEPRITFRNLPFLRPSVLYVFGGESDLSTPEFRKMKIERTGIGVGGSGGAQCGRVKEVVLEGIGHLVAMDAVGSCAEAAAMWFDQEMQRWRKEEEAFRREWSKKKKQDKFMIDEEWMKRIGAKPGRSNPGGLNKL